MASYVDHVAIKSTDGDETLRFFCQVFGMTLKEIKGEAPKRKIWTNEGIQINEVDAYSSKGGSFDHVCIHVDDKPAIMKAAEEYGCTPIPGKEDHWFTMPDGTKIELV